MPLTIDVHLGFQPDHIGGFLIQLKIIHLSMLLIPVMQQRKETLPLLGMILLDYLQLHAFFSKTIEDGVNIQRTSRIGAESYENKVCWDMLVSSVFLFHFGA